MEHNHFRDCNRDAFTCSGNKKTWKGRGQTIHRGIFLQAPWGALMGILDQAPQRRGPAAGEYSSVVLRNPCCRHAPQEPEEEGWEGCDGGSGAASFFVRSCLRWVFCRYSSAGLIFAASTRAGARGGPCAPWLFFYTSWYSDSYEKGCATIYFHGCCCSTRPPG